MTTPTIAVKESLDDLKEIGPSTGIGGFKLVHVIGKGTYQYKAGDQSSNISTGNSSDSWVAPSEDTSGKLGAWERIAYDKDQVDTFTQGQIDGLELSNGSDADHDIDIATGVCSMRDGSGNYNLFELTQVKTKQIDANWAPGGGAGGFPSGLTLTADTWYRFFVIGKDDGTVDGGFDTSASATNLLADATGYSWFRQIRWQRTGGTSNLTPTLQRGDYVYFTNGFNRDFKNSNPGTAAVTAVMLVPPDEIGIFMFALHDNTTAGGFTAMLVMGKDQTMGAPGADKFDLQTSSANGDIRTQTMKMLKVNSSSQIHYRLNISTADHTVYGFSNGWIDSRGRDN